MFLHSSGIIQCVFFTITKRTRKLILVLCILISGLDFEPPILAFLDLPLLLLYTLSHLILFELATSFFPTLILWQLPQTSDAALQAKRRCLYVPSGVCSSSGANVASFSVFCLLGQVWIGSVQSKAEVQVIS